MNAVASKNLPSKNQAQESLPYIGITMGDPAGIGPEIVLKAVSDPDLRKFCKPLIVGDLRYLRRVSKDLGLRLDLSAFDKTDSGKASDRAVSVFDLRNLEEEFPLGIESAAGGRASAGYIEASVDLWKNKTIEAIVTAPINKKALAMGGYDYPGHTEFLAALTGTEDFAMSFFAGKLCVVLLSTHVSLRNAIELVKTEDLAELIIFTEKNVSALLKRKVKIAVAGLNPHASEDGMFGTEEADEITPAVELCREKFGIDVSGPFSPDTIFLRGYEGEFDAVVSCYHDQATIAVKCLSFGASVNVTLGLPLIRTSVDHGTAYDIVGKNSADSSSLKAAISLAADFVRIRKNK
ncbi:MAG: 4-hydroxythreonine-4-phosphate dehydrogenase PdxA [Pyrinomonadaceae bacterium]